MRIITASFPLALALVACGESSTSAPPVASPPAPTAVASAAVPTQASPPPPAAATPPENHASACTELARKCHGHGDTELAKTCHHMGHAAKSEDECAAKTAECLQACSGGEDAHDHEH